jgi:hypothetical protein
MTTMTSRSKRFGLNRLLAGLTGAPARPTHRHALEPLEPRAFLSAIATPVPLTGESVIFSDPAGAKYGQDIIALPDGSSVVTWVSSDGDALGVFAARVDPSGKQIGQTIPVNAFTEGFQTNPTIAPRSGGGFLIAWHGLTNIGDYGVQAQIFDALGDRIGPAINVVADFSSVNQTPDAFLLPDGDFIVTWASTGNTGHNGVHARRYDPNGGLVINATFNVNQDAYTGDNDTLNPVGAALSDGSYVITWRADNHTLMAQRFDAFSDFSGANVTLVDTPAYIAFPTAIAPLPAGGFVIAWSGGPDDGSQPYDVYAQRFNSSLSPAGIDTLVNTFTSKFQTNPTLAPLPDSGFVVVWNSSDQDGDSWGVYGQSFDASGVARGTEFHISQQTLGTQANPRIASRLDGTFVIAYSSQPGSSGDTLIRSYEGQHLNDAPLVDSNILDPLTVITSQFLAHHDILSAFDFNPGPGESDQSLLRYEILNSDFFRFIDQPTISSDGTLSFTTAPGASGLVTFFARAYDNGGTDFGGVDFVDFQFSLNLIPPNAQPVISGFTHDVSIPEDFGPFATVYYFDPGSPDEADQTGTFEIFDVYNSFLFSSVTISQNGTLEFTTAPSVSGTAIIDLIVRDSGGTDNGGIDTSEKFSVIVNILPVNDQPAFFASNPPTVDEDAGLKFIPNWATFNPGASNETDQTPTYTVFAEHPENFSQQPAVSSKGTLSYQLAPNVNGPQTISVKVQDSGPDGPGDQNASGLQSFVISATPVNDAPSFKASNPAAINENSGPVTLDKWAAGSPGPADESDQSLAYIVTGVSKPSLFLTPPSIAPDGTLTYTPAPYAFGISSFTVALKDDGGITHGGSDTSATQTFTITITHVPTPKINVASTLPNLGNGVSDNSTTPFSSNGTNFGTGYQSSEAISRTFTVNNPGDLPLNITKFSLPAGFILTEGLSDTIAAGKSDTFTITLPTNLPGTFSGDVQFDTNVAAFSHFNFALTGIIAGGEYHTFTAKTPAKDRTFTDNLFNKITLGLTGPGTGKIFISTDNRLMDLSLTDTSSRTSTFTLTLARTSASNKANSPDSTSLASVNITGGLVAFNAAKSNLLGSFTSSAAVGSLTLNDVITSEQNTITILGTSADKTSFSFGRLAEVSIRTQTSVNSFKALDWQDDNGIPDDFTAISLRSMNIVGRAAGKTVVAAPGDMEADISLTLPAGTKVGGHVYVPLVNTISIAGNSQSYWNLGAHKVSSTTIKGNALGVIDAYDIGTLVVTGDAQTLFVHSDKDLTAFTAKHAENVELDVTGSIGTITAAQWTAGSVKAAKLTTLRTVGLLSRPPRGPATVIFAGDFTGDLNITGLSSTVNAQSVGSITIQGSVIGDGVSSGLDADWSLTGGVGAIKIGSTGAFSAGGNVTGLVLQTHHKLANQGNLASLTITGQAKNTSIEIASKSGAVSLGSSDHLNFSANAEILSFSALKVVLETVLVSSLAIGPVTVGTWESGSINAPKVASLTTKGIAAAAGSPAVPGDFTGKVEITGTPGKPNELALGRVNISGTLQGYDHNNSTWSIQGKATDITVGTMLNTTLNIAGNLTSYTSKLGTGNSYLNVSKNVGSITIQKWVGGAISAARVSSITTKTIPASAGVPIKYGEFTGQVTLTGAGLPQATKLINSVNIAGQLAFSNWNINGNAGTFTVGSTLLAKIFVGVSGKIDILNAVPTQDADFNLYDGKHATLAGFTLTGQGSTGDTAGFYASAIAAGTINNISLKRVPTTETDPYGIVASDKITSYTRFTGNPPPNQSIKLANKTLPALYDTLGSYTLKIV